MSEGTKKKEKLIFSTRWNKVMELTWSGSTYAIFKELEKRYELERFDIQDDLHVKAFRAARKLGLCKGEPPIYSMIKSNNNRFRKTYGTEKVKVFQFSEMPFTEATENYIYQDLIAAYIRFMKDNDPVAYQYCGFTNFTDKELEKRTESQRQFYDKCKGVFTMGQWLADFMVETGVLPVEKVHAVGAGINVDVASIDNTAKTGNKLLFVGKDFKRKGGELVIEAFQLLREKYISDAELYIIGPEQKPYEGDIPGITFVGNTDKAGVTRHLNMCDVFCMPSYFEAFGIAFCEALVYGLPCIARNKYAMKEIVRNGEDGYLLEGNSPQELAELMHKALPDEVMKEKVRNNRAYYIEKYAWKTVADRMVEVLEESC